MAECFFHTGTPATTRCKQCGRPLCTQCRLVTDSGIFCSDKCAQTGEVFVKRAARLESVKSGAKPAWPGKLIKFVIFLVILYVVYRLVRQYLPAGILENIRGRLGK